MAQAPDPDEQGRELPSNPSLYDLNRDELASLLDGEPRFRLDQLWSGLYEKLLDPADISNLPKTLRGAIEGLLPPGLLQVRRSVSRDGGTIKFLWQLRDGFLIETVLMHYDDRTTVCISSQAGCAMACGFCATGQAGFDRHLTVGEIVEQVIRGMLGELFPDAQFVITGALGPGGNAHGPNEFLHVPTAVRVTECLALLLRSHATR